MVIPDSLLSSRRACRSPESIDYPRDNSKGRSEVHPLCPLGVPPVNENHDWDHKDGPTIGKITPPTQAATPHFQSGEARGSAYGVPNDFR